MANIQSVSTAGNIADILARRELTDKSLSEVTTGKACDDEQDESAFDSVLGELLPTAEPVESEVIVLDETMIQQDVAVVDDEDETLPLVDELNATIVTPPVIPVQVAIADNVPSGSLLPDTLNIVREELQTVDLAQQEQDLPDGSPHIDLIQEMTAKTNIKASTTVDVPPVTAALSAMPTNTPNSGVVKVEEVVVAPLELASAEMSEKPILPEALFDLWRDQIKLKPMVDAVDTVTQPKVRTIDEEVMASVEQAPESEVLQPAPEVRQKVQSGSLFVQKQESTPVKPLVLNDAMGESEVKQPTPEMAIDGNTELRKEKIASRFDNKRASVSLGEDAPVIKRFIGDEYRQKGTMVDDSAKAGKIQIVQSMDAMRMIDLEKTPSRNSQLLQTADVARQEGYDFGDIYSGLNIDTQGWEQGLGHRILWMRKGGIDRVSIQIEPPELGPLGIQLRVFDNKANLTFTSHNPEIKEILEGATSKLHSMFSEQGMGLGQVQVNISSSQQFSGNHGNAQYQASPTKSYNRGVSAAVGSIGTASAGRGYTRPMGLVDYYA